MSDCQSLLRSLTHHYLQDEPAELTLPTEGAPGTSFLAMKISLPSGASTRKGMSGAPPPATEGSPPLGGAARPLLLGYISVSASRSTLVRVSR